MYNREKIIAHQYYFYICLFLFVYVLYKIIVSTGFGIYPRFFLFSLLKDFANNGTVWSNYKT